MRLFHAHIFNECSFILFSALNSTNITRITHGFWETTRFLIVTIYMSLDKRFSTRLVCSRIETRDSFVETRLVRRDETR